MNIPLTLSIAAGGALGAALRHILSSHITRLVGYSIFPWGILAANVLGALVLGLLVETMALRWSVSNELRAFLLVGLLGGFTTFSAFTLDVVLMSQRGETLLAGAYVVVSVTLSCAALLAGTALARLLWA